MTHDNAAKGRYATSAQIVTGQEVALPDTIPQTGDIAVPATQTEPEIRFQLEPIRPVWNDFVKYHGMKAEAVTFIEQFKPLLRQRMGRSNANTLVLDGFRVGTYKAVDTLQRKLLEAERPDIIAKYTRTRQVTGFDEAAFRADMPDVWAAYRTHSLNLIAKPTPVL